MGDEQKVTKIKDPIVIKNYFAENKYNNILKYINSIDRNRWAYEYESHRYTYQSNYFNTLSILEMDRAREIFKSNTLLYTYSLLALYNDDMSNLKKHKDDNACTYTIDVCLYNKSPWPLIIEDKEYLLYNNEAVCFYGEDQWHERPVFEKDNKVLMLFMHFAEPDHIYFKDPRD